MLTMDIKSNSNFRRGLRMNKFDVIKKYIDEFDYYGLLASTAFRK